VEGKVRLLIVVQLGATAAALAVVQVVASVPIEPAPVAFVVFTVALVGITLLPPIYVDLRRHGSHIAPNDAAYVLGLVVVGPIGMVLSVAVTGVVAMLRAGQTPLKRAFNLVGLISGAAMAALVYTLVGGAGPLSLRTWVGAVLALVVIAAWDTVTTTLVLAISEQEPVRAVAAQIAPAQLIGLAVSAPFALIALVLYAWAWPSLLLLAPLLGLLHLLAGSAVRQRAERQRVQQLAHASAQLVELVDASAMLDRIAELSRALVTGASAIAISLDSDGATTARLVDDHGQHLADAPLLRATLDLVEQSGSTSRGEVAADVLDRTTRRQLPVCSNILWVVHHGEDAEALIVAVFRELLPDGGDAHRADVMATFVAHAATALVNVRLLAELRRNLAQEQALSRRKDEFVATVSHELRTPLTSIAGAVETLRHRGERIPVADRDRLLDLAINHGARLRGLIDDLLLVAESDHPTPTRRHVPVDMLAMLEGLDQEFRPQLDGRFHVSSEVVDRWVSTDGDKVRRILVHLLDNARKFAPGAGVWLSMSQRPSRFELVVADHGPGIAATHREEVFDRFVQLDGSTTRQRGGLGLGLHLCRQLADALDGRLDIDETPGGGARFTLSLPIGESTDAPLPDAVELPYRRAAG
jgi:signal transduction histidine kinase